LGDLSPDLGDTTGDLRVEFKLNGGSFLFVVVSMDFLKLLFFAEILLFIFK
jgi:hypothetical protein